MKIPETQTAYGYEEGERRIIKFKDHPVKKPRDGEVLLKIEAAGMCLSDPHILVAGPSLSDDTPTKFVMGHEIAGQIIQVGSNLAKDDRYKVGSRYALTIPYSCGVCENCRAGRDSTCLGSHGFAYGLNQDGGFQEYLLISNLRTLIPIPDDVSYEVAAVSTDAVLTPFHAIQKVKREFQPTTKVLLLGLGGLGLNALQILKAYNPYIVACDIKPELKELALKYGANEFHTDINKTNHPLESFDIAFDFCGIQATFDAAQKYLKHHSKLMMIGLGRSKLTIRNYELARREIQVIFSFGGTSLEQIECMKWISLGKIKPFVQIAPLNELPKYLYKLVEGGVQGRIVFRPSKM